LTKSLSIIKEKGVGMFGKYRNLFIFLFISLLVFVVAIDIGLKKISGADSGVWGFFVGIDTATAIALAILAFLAYAEYIKNYEKIKLFYKIYSPDGSYEIKPIKFKNFEFYLLRKDFSRAEILGILSMLCIDSKNRFNISNNYLEEFFEELRKVENGKKEMIVPLTRDEYNLHFNYEGKL
jgi:hypothetical protein